MTDGDGHLPLWFSRFKTRYRFSQLTVCCKIVRHTAPCSFEQDYVRPAALSPVEEVTWAQHYGSLGATQSHLKNT
jgi:hypothetical protein